MESRKSSVPIPCSHGEADDKVSPTPAAAKRRRTRATGWQSALKDEKTSKVACEVEIKHGEMTYVKSTVATPPLDERVGALTDQDARTTGRWSGD